ncbi:MAG: hypothetical protein ABSH51_01360 [Solirubrobacteraceae bacterium]
MPTLTTFLSGVDGAVGCDLDRRPGRNELLFVEYAGSLSSVNLSGAPVKTVLGSGYTNPEDVKASRDNVHAYVTERSGALVRVALASASTKTVICSGMTAPQQLFLDEAHDTAYVVEYATPARLWRINLTSGAKTDVGLSGLENAVGLVLSANLQYAYISEQLPTGSRVSEFNLATLTRRVLATGLTQAFFLTWADAGQSTLLVTERGSADRLTAINVAHATSNVIASGLPTLPSCPAVLNPGVVLVCCNDVIEEVNLTVTPPPPPPPGGEQVLLYAIGNIPVGDINVTSGLATTPSTAVYPVTGAPFGGSLSLLVNYPQMTLDGAKYYRVLVDGVAQLNSWTVELAPGPGTDTIAPTTVGATTGCYPVFTGPFTSWVPAYTGDVLDTTTLSDALHTITIELVNAAGTIIGVTSNHVKIRVDNNPCIGTLGPVTVGAATENACGLLVYGSTSDTVEMPFTASQPNGFATFSFGVIRAQSGVTLPAAPPTSGPVSAAVSPITSPVSGLLGVCTTAAFAESIYVAATATNGYSRQSQYDAGQIAAFALET